MAIKAVIFDLDGTLVDSSKDICFAINYALDGLNVRKVTVPETISLIGEGISRLFEKLIELRKISADRDLMIRRFSDYYADHLVDNTAIYPGVIETLQSLDGCRKAIISNKREEFSVRVLESLGIGRFFELVVGSDTTSEKKPSPLPIRYVLSKFGIDSGEAVIVGDSTYDIEAGKAAGIGTIAVTYGYRPVDLLREADYIVDSMPEILKIVQEFRS
jgi:phosphoglycolate phosphatase